jgi:preprotein translocase subunit SecY
MLHTILYIVNSQISLKLTIWDFTFPKQYASSVWVSGAMSRVHVVTMLITSPSCDSLVISSCIRTVLDCTRPSMKSTFFWWDFWSKLSSRTHSEIPIYYIFYIFFNCIFCIFYWYIYVKMPCLYTAIVYVYSRSPQL